MQPTAALEAFDASPSWASRFGGVIVGTTFAATLVLSGQPRLALWSLVATVGLALLGRTRLHWLTGSLLALGTGVLLAVTGGLTTAYPVLYIFLLFGLALTSPPRRFAAETALLVLQVPVLYAFTRDPRPGTIQRSLVTLMVLLLVAGFANALATRLRSALGLARLQARDLEEREQRFRSLFDRSPDSMCLLDVQGRFTGVNRALVDLFGYPAARLLGSTFDLLLREEDRPETWQRFADAAAGMEQRLTIVARRADGGLIDLSVTGVPVVVRGRVEGVFVHGRDVTDLIRVTSALERHADRQATLAGLGLAAIERPYAELLDEAARLVGAALGAEEAVISAAPGAPAAHERHVLLRADESRPALVLRWASPPALTVEDEQFLAMAGALLRVAGAREQSERARREEAAWLRLALWTGDMQAWELELGTDTVSWSAQPDGIDGPPLPQIITGTRWTDMIHPSDRPAADAAWQEAQRTGQPFRREYRIVLPDGRVRWIADTGRIVQGDDGPERVLGVAMDVTDRRREQEAAQRREEALAHAQKMEALGQLAGGVAHDFNNVLTAILGFAEVIERGPGRGDEVEQIRRAVDRARTLVEQLLTFGRRRLVGEGRVDVAAGARDVTALLDRLIGEHITMQVRIPADVGTVPLDAAQLEQVVLNLALNARDAMPGGGELLLEAKRVTLAVEDAASHGIAAGPYVRLVVRDTGIGMRPEVRAHVFEPFYTTKPEGQGTGMGMASVYGIVTGAGGRIMIDSAPGAGTTVVVDLPAVEPESREAPALPRRPARVPGHAHATVLLVEDQVQIRALVQDVLGARGYRVLAAPDGQAGLDVAAAYDGPIDLLLTDVVMPQLNGVELADRLRELFPGLRVLFMSGYARGEALRAAQGGDGNGFIQKPFSLDALLDRVEALMAGEVGLAP